MKLRVKNKKLTVTIIILLLMLMYIGYALLSQNLIVNGNSKIKSSTWDIHFDNIKVTSGSVQISENDSAAVIDSNDNTKINYSVTLNTPGDFYEFTVDAKNYGSIDGLVEKLTTTITIDNGTPIDVTENPTSLPKYLLYSVKYANGDDIVANQLLKSLEKTTYRVRIEYNKDLNPTDLPGEVKNIGVNIDTDYVQSSGNEEDNLVNYQIIHKYQNIDEITYTDVVENLQGRSDIVFTAPISEREGFNNPDAQEVILKSDGSSVITYVYSRKKFTLTLEDSENIETVTTSGEYYYGTSVTLVAKDVEGRIFKKWSNGETSREITFNLTEDITIKPIYEKNTFEVTFNANGGTVSPTSVEVNNGQAISSLPIPIYEGYYLDGWYTALESGTLVTEAYVPVSDIEIFAIWKKSVESIDVEDDKLNIPLGQSQPIVITNPSDIEEDYTYSTGDSSVAMVDDGGNVTAIGEGETDITITGSESGQEIKVHIVVTYAVTFNANGGTASFSRKVVAEGNSVGELPSATMDNSYLDGWYVGLNPSIPIDEEYEPHNDVEVFAKWGTSVESIELEEDVINLDVGENYIINILNADEIDEEYTFESSDSDIVEVDEDGKINAKDIGEAVITIRGSKSHKTKTIEVVVSSSNSYIVTFNPNGGRVSPTSKVVAIDSEVGSLPIPTKDGSVFNGWYTSVDSGVRVNTSTIVSASITYFAHWTEKYNCTFDGELVQGAEYVNGQYTYRYMQELNGSYWADITEDGWGVVLTDKNSSDPVTSNLCSSINNKPVVSMMGMFSNSNTTSIDTSSFDTSNVVRMDHMFDNTKFSSIDLTSFDTSNVTSITGLFNDNNVIEEIDLSNFKNDNLEYAGSLFPYSGNLKKVNLSNFNIIEAMDHSDYSIYTNNPIEVIIDNWTIENVSGTILDNFPSANKISARNIVLPSDISSLFSYSDNLEEIDVTGWDLTGIENLSHLFENDYNLNNIVGLDTWNTSDVTNMSNMFYYCGSLTNLDLSTFNTSKVTDMSNMFYGCSSLTDINLDTFNTSKVTDMSYMFYGCSSLTEIDLSSFNTSNVIDMSNMFYGCSSLTEIDLSNFRSDKLTSVEYMLTDCNNLEKVNLADFNLANVYGLDYLISTNSNYELIIDNWVISNVDNSYITIFSGANKISARNLKLPKYASRLFSNTDNNYSLQSIDVTGWNLTNCEDISSMFSGNEYLEEITGLDIWDTSNITDMSFMFYYCSLLTELDVSSFDTSNVTDMSSMFYNCSSLTELDLSNFRSDNLSKAESMFGECYSIEKLNLKNFNLASTYNGSSIIDTNDVYELIIDNWVIPSNFGSILEMFYNASTISAKNITISGSAYGLFADYNSYGTLKRIDVSGGNLSNCTNMSEMFYGNSQLEEIIGLDTWNTSNVEYISSMFYGCSSLTSIDLSSFDTLKINDMSYMFYGCNSVEEIDLSGFDTINVENTNSMFEDCTSLQKIYAYSSFVNTNIIYSDYMFNNDENLCGGNGTCYDSEKIDKEYAKLDGGNSDPGYFSNRGLYKVTFNMNGGSAQVTKKYLQAGDKVGTLPVPVKEKAYFIGWYTSLVNGTLVTEETIINGNTTFFAKWKNTVEVANVKKKNMIILQGESESINILNPEDIEENYTFASSDNSIATVDANGLVSAVGVGETTIIITGVNSNKSISVNVNSTDNPQLIKYYVVFDPNGGTVSTEGREVSRTTSIGNLPVPTRDNMVFIGWYTGIGSGDLVTEGYVPTSDLTIYANWRNYYQYTITFDKNNDNATGSMDNQILTETMYSNLSENGYSLEDYLFVGWNTERDGSGTSYLDKENVSLNQNITLYAQWIRAYKVTFDKNDSNATGNTYTMTVASGSTVEIPQEAFTAYSLGSKSIDSYNTNPDISGTSYRQSSTIIVTGDITLYAEWVSTIYWALQSSKTRLVISSTRVTGNEYGSFKDNENVYPWRNTPLIDSTDSNVYKVSEVTINGTVSPKSTATWFDGLGYGATSVTINVNGLDTSRVTNMSNMFAMAGRNSSSFTIVGLNNFDTSNVTNMHGMFECAGSKATSWNIGDLSGWKTSKVTNMSNMFSNDINAGNNPTFNIGNLDDWDVSNVTDMSDMFFYAGYRATTWNVGDLSEWKVSNVENFVGMFENAAYMTQSWSVGDLSGWNTESAKYISRMFLGTGHNSTTWNIGNISHWKTSKVTSIWMMFYNAASNAETVDLDLSGWDTSNIKDMTGVFCMTGYLSTTFKVNLSGWDTSKAEVFYEENLYSNTIYYRMFDSAGYNATTWEVIIPHTNGGGISNDTTHLYGKNTSLFIDPPSGRTFTLASS